MTRYLIPALAVLVAGLAELGILLVHGWRDHGWPERARAWLRGMPPPLVPPHHLWWARLPARVRWSLTALFWAVCLADAALFILAPWAAVALAWAEALASAVFQFRPRHGAPAHVNPGA